MKGVTIKRYLGLNISKKIFFSFLLATLPILSPLTSILKQYFIVFLFSD